jgi:hypothetical protein
VADTDDRAPARPTNRGFGRVLVAVYGLFALAATARSAVQIATKFHEAPLAYLLSAFAAVVYIVATMSLARRDAASRRVASVAISVELVGVITVGTASELFSKAFPHATVWTGFGSGYGFVPLVLPFVGLWWLRLAGLGVVGRLPLRSSCQATRTTMESTLTVQSLPRPRRSRRASRIFSRLRPATTGDAGCRLCSSSRTAAAGRAGRTRPASGGPPR